MTGVKFEIQADHVLHMLTKMVDQTSDLTPVWKKVAVQAEKTTAQTFRAQGRPAKWVGLKPKTLAARRKKGKGGQILMDSGVLRASVTTNVAIKRISPLKIEYGTNLIYAATHQYGRGKIPARPFLRWQDADIEIIKKIFEKHLAEGAK